MELPWPYKRKSNTPREFAREWLYLAGKAPLRRGTENGDCWVWKGDAEAKVCYEVPMPVYSRLEGCQTVAELSAGYTTRYFAIDGLVRAAERAISDGAWSPPAGGSLARD